MADKEIRKRGANYTTEEKTLLADLVMKYKHVIEDKRTGGIFIQKKKEAWNAVTIKYNANATTGRRETEQLKALYDNMKQKARKNVGESNKSEYINRKPLAEVTEEDLARALQNIKEDKKQMNKTGGGCYKPKTSDSDAKILAIIQEQVQPLHNPFDSGAFYFKDNMNTNQREESLNVNNTEEASGFVKIQEIEITDDDNLHQMSLDLGITNFDSLPSTSQGIATSQGIEITQTGEDQHQGKKLKRKNTSTRKVPMVQKKLKKNTSAEALKRLYFKKKCENAALERKKLMLEVLQMKQRHALQIMILKKQL